MPLEKGWTGRGPLRLWISGSRVDFRRRVLLLILGGLLLGPWGSVGAAPPRGTFVTALGDTPDNLNPYLHSLLASSAVYRYTFDSLSRVDFQGRWEPALATSSTVSKDGRAWTFTLRRGVRWSDGAPFTSADVKYTWQLATNPGVHVTYATGFDRISSIDTPTPGQVVYHLREPYAPFKEQVAGAPIVPRHLLGHLAPEQINHSAFNRRPVGTGPFRVVDFVPDDHVTLLPNPYYWGERPRLRRLVVRIVPDEDARVNLLRAGELSLLPSVPPSRLEEIRRLRGVVALRYLAPVYALVQLDEYQFLRDVRVRQALDFATPKASIIRTVMKGQAEPAASDMVPTGPWANRRLHPRPYDPAQARRILRDAGFAPGPGGYLFKDGRRLDIPLWTVSSHLQDVRIMQVIAQAWREIGVYTETHAVSPAALFGQDGPQWNGKDAALIFSWGQGVFPENKINWHSAYIPKDASSPGENAERYANPEMDRLLEAADRTVDEAKRHLIYDRIQELEWRDVPVIFLFWYVNTDAVASSVRGYAVTTFGTTAPETWDVP
jgi:peptide/nickel transport system substrate-binding protein